MWHLIPWVSIGRVPPNEQLTLSGRGPVFPGREVPISSITGDNGRYLYAKHPFDDNERMSPKRTTLTKDSTPCHGR